MPVYQLSPQMLTRYALKHHRLSGRPDQVEGQTLVVIDEAQRIFNPRDYDKNDRRAWLDWLPEHRKYGFNIILISPYDKMIDKQIRALFEYEVKHRKANNYGFIGFLLSVFRLPVFFAITYWYGLRARCGAEAFLCLKRYTRIYDTFQRFGVDGDALLAAGAGVAAAPVRGPAMPAATAEQLCRLALEGELVYVLGELRQQRISDAREQEPCRFVGALHL